MRTGKANIILVIAIVFAVLILGFIGYLQYRHYVQQKNIEKIEDEIMNNASLFK